MRKLTKADRERIRDEVRASMRSPAPVPAITERKTLSCGHDDNVAPGLDPHKAICGQCQARAMRSPTAIKGE